MLDQAAAVEQRLRVVRRPRAGSKDGGQEFDFAVAAKPPVAAFPRCDAAMGPLATSAMEHDVLRALLAEVVDQIAFFPSSGEM